MKLKPSEVWCRFNRVRFAVFAVTSVTMSTGILCLLILLGLHSSAAQEVTLSISGLVVAALTPLNDDQTINYNVIPPYAKYLATKGFGTVLVGGSTGEHMALSVQDRKELIAAWVKVAETTGQRIVVQVGGAPFKDVMELTRYSESIGGVDALLTLPELYFKPKSVDELVFYMEQVAAAAPKLPLLYYHNPGSTNVKLNIAEFVVAATASIPNFKGVKYTANDLIEASQIKRNLVDGQEIFIGRASLLAPALLLGLNSSMSSGHNLFPEYALRILTAMDNGDVTTAHDVQEKLSVALEAISAEGQKIPALKAAMEIKTGLKMGPPALPERPISEEGKRRIKRKLNQLGII